SHFISRASDELHRHRLLGRIPQRLLDRLASLANRRLAGDHLRDVEPRTKAAHSLAKRKVADTGHRRENHGRFDPYRTDINGTQSGGHHFTLPKKAASL